MIIDKILNVNLLVKTIQQLGCQGDIDIDIGIMLYTIFYMTFDLSYEEKKIKFNNTLRFEQFLVLPQLILIQPCIDTVTIYFTIKITVVSIMYTYH